MRNVDLWGSTALGRIAVRSMNAPDADPGYPFHEKHNKRSSPSCPCDGSTAGESGSGNIGVT